MKNYEKYFDKIKSITNKLLNDFKLKQYIFEKGYHGKSYILSFIIKLFWRLTLALILFLALFYFTKDYAISIIFLIEIYLLLIIIMYKINSVKYTRVRNNVYNEIANCSILKKLDNFNTFEFNEYLKELLLRKEISEIEDNEVKYLDMIGLYKNNLVGIKFYKYKQDYEVNIKDIKDFYHNIRLHNLCEGIIITTSDFDDECVEYSEKNEKRTKIHLINNDKIIKLHKEVDMYPSSKDVEKMIFKEISEKKQNRKLFNIIIEKNGTYKYLSIALIMFLMSKITVKKTQYKIFTYILLLYALISFSRSIVSIFAPKIKENEKIL